MAFPKPGAAATALFDEMFPDDEDVVRKPMFGHTAAFVNGHMFMGTFGDDVVLRLGEADHAKLSKVKGVAPFEPMKGRPMKAYLVVPRGWRDDVETAREWAGRALKFGRALPPKAKKAATKKKK